jgi:hypothetical protein
VRALTAGERKVNGTSDGRIAERAETNRGGCCGGGRTLLGVVGVYYLWRRQMRTSRDAVAVVESGAQVNSDIEG